MDEEISHNQYIYNVGKEPKYGPQIEDTGRGHTDDGHESQNKAHTPTHDMVLHGLRHGCYHSQSQDHGTHGHDTSNHQGGIEIITEE
jgi:hypothetical protein